MCDRVREGLDSIGADYHVVDIDEDPKLRREMGNLIPLVEMDGKLVFDSAMDPADLAESIAAVGVR